jgi:hypothetical protein
VFQSNEEHSIHYDEASTCRKNCKSLHLFGTVQEPNVDLRLRAGALFFIILSMAIFSIFVMGWFVYIDLFLIVLFGVAIIYFLGGVIALLRNERKAMFPIFAVNLLSFVFVLVFYLAYLYGYFTDPCYIEPMSCDDQLTDAPAELKAITVWTGILALFTYMSWRLQRGYSIETDNEE